MSFEVKDSGKRQTFEGGMVRDVTEDKVDYTLVLDGPMFQRWAEHMTKGAQKYAKRNWMLAEGEAELDRFRESALRHLLQWLAGKRDEDHAAAVIFNINGAEYVRAKMHAIMKERPPRFVVTSPKAMTPDELRVLAEQAASLWGPSPPSPLADCVYEERPDRDKR